MIFYILCLGFVVASINGQNKERKASLLVLPPLVLGYEELYADALAKSTENSGPDPTRQNREHPKAELRNSHPAEQENTEYLPLDTKKTNDTKDDEEFSDEFSDDLSDEMSIEGNVISEDRKADVVEKIQRRSKRSAHETSCPCQRG